MAVVPKEGVLPPPFPRSFLLKAESSDQERHLFEIAELGPYLRHIISESAISQDPKVVLVHIKGWESLLQIARANSYIQVEIRQV